MIIIVYVCFFFQLGDGDYKSREKYLHMKKSLILIITFIIFIDASFSASAVLDPSFEFSTIETEHFYIHYHQGLDDAAQKIVHISETMHDKLVKTFNWEPREKTNIVLVDGTDFTNGFATSIPYNLIYLFTVPPSIDMTIGEYEDWLEMLFIHEYSHILSLDSSRGYSNLRLLLNQ